jgi:glycosyltransferase 2 family protein
MRRCARSVEFRGNHQATLSVDNSCTSSKCLPPVVINAIAVYGPVMVGRPKPAASPWRKIAIVSSKLMLGIALIGWLAWTGRFDPRVYRDLFQKEAAFFLLGVFLGQAIVLLVPLFRWWLLVRAQGIPLSLTEAVRVSLMGAFANLFVPGGLGIDGLRLLYLHRHYRDQLVAGAASVFLDRILGLIALLILGGTCATIFLLREDNPWMLCLLLFNVLLILGLCLAFAVAFGFMGTGTLNQFRRIQLMNRMIEAVQVYRSHWDILVWGLAISFGGHFGLVMAASFGFRSLGYPVTLAGVATIAPIVTMARSIPLTPLGLGITDSVAAFAYPLVNQLGGAEMQMLLRGTMTLTLLACGLAYFLHRGKAANESDQQQEFVEEALVGGDG